MTQLRAAIRKLLRDLDQDSSVLAGKVRSVLTRDDDYASVGKPPCDWDDRAAREALVDALVGDGHAALAALEGATLVGAPADAAALLALVVGQDVAEGDEGLFRIVRGVAKDRVISTVDPEARHGHKSRNRRFDGYKTHGSIDPDSELVDEVVVTPANAPDRDAVDDLLAPNAEEDDKPEVVGDSAYAGAETRDKIGRAGYKIRAKVPPVRNRGGRFSKDRFAIHLDDNTVVCPAGQRVAIVALRRGGGRASFGVHCGTCPLRQCCTSARKGRSVTIHPHEALLQAARAEQATPEWLERYWADRPIVERKMAHLGRTQGPMSRPVQDLHRYRHQGGRAQLRAPGRARRRPHRRRVGGGAGLRRASEERPSWSNVSAKRFSQIGSRSFLLRAPLHLAMLVAVPPTGPSQILARLDARGTVLLQQSPRGGLPASAGVFAEGPSSWRQPFGG